MDDPTGDAVRAWMVAASAAALVVAIGGCGADEPGSTTGGGPPEAAVGDPLSELGGDQLCGLLPKADAEDAMDVKVASVEGKAMAKAPFTIVSCTYQADSETPNAEFNPPKVETRVAGSYRGDAQQALDRVFTDTDDKVIDYQKVDGLGVVAGYGAEPVLAEFGGQQLVVLFEAGGERYDLRVRATPEGELDKLRPLAEKVLPALTKKLVRE